MERQPAKNFQDLIVWQKAHQFVLATYRLTADLGYGNTKSFMAQLEEVSRLLTAYASAILDSDS